MTHENETKHFLIEQEYPVKASSLKHKKLRTSAFASQLLNS